MTGNRPVVVLGVVSIVSALFFFVDGKYEFVHLRGGGVVVALVLGVLACVAGLLGNRPLTLVAGAAFLLAAAVLLVLLPRGGGFLEGNGSTFSVWLGLGAGLVALAITRTPQE